MKLLLSSAGFGRVSPRRAGENLAGESNAAFTRSVGGQMRPLPDEYHFNRFAGELLTRGLAIAGESAPAEVLWNWLGIGLDEHAHGRLDREHKERIAAWLAGRPEIYRALLEQALLQCANGPEPLHCLFRAEHRFYGADLPAGVDEWCFERAAMSGEVLRRHLFDKAAIALLRRLDYTPALLEALLSVVVRHPVLQENVDLWLKSGPEEWRRLVDACLARTANPSSGAEDE